MKKQYTFDDISLLPKFSTVESRLDPDLTTEILPNIYSKYPIVNSPMDTVISNSDKLYLDLSNIISDNGGIPIFPRFKDLSIYRDLMQYYKNKYNLLDKIIVSVGVNLTDCKYLIDLGFNNILIDTAFGDTSRMMSLLNNLKKYSQKALIIAGNVCTKEGTRHLIDSGASCIRVGIGSGAACTTRIQTAIGVPQFSAIINCVEEADRNDIPIIADGGINTPRDMCLAIAAGASSVMMGKKIATCWESSAPKKPVYNEDGIQIGFEVFFRGQASYEYQIDHYGQIKEGTVCEGVGFWTRGSGNFKTFLDEYLGGLRSSMTYLNAKNLIEYRNNAEFIEVTSTFMKESFPRKD